MAKRRMMWMGPRNSERWVPAADTKPDFSRVGVREQDQYLNGGAGVRGVKGGHREYNMTWTGRSPDEMRPVLDMAEGLYDTGENFDLIYFLDPNTLSRNVLAPMYAAPFKTGDEGVPMVEDEDGYPEYPTLVPTPSNALHYPGRSARYTLTAGSRAVPVYVPIPEGMTLWFGAHGEDHGVGVAVTPYELDAAGAQVVPDLMPVTTRTRFNYSVSSTTGATGVELALVVRQNAASPAYSDLSGLMVQILPNGALPLDGEFISGQGNSGCEFAGIPTESPYLNGRMTVMTGKLVETGSWR